MNAVIVDPSDDAAVVIEDIKKGSTVSYLQNGCTVELIALNDIKIYHKVAVRDISAGEPVTKYGEHIAVAGRNISKGEHIHEHNLTSRRENL